MVCVVVAAPIAGGFLEQMSVLSPAAELAQACELPMITQQVLPVMPYLTEAGLALAVVIAIGCAVSFRLAGTEVLRYRALSVAVTLGWTAVVLGVLVTWLALWVFPGVKCGA